jgi:hypothetical protein
MHLIPYVNMGLVYGYQRSLAGDKQELHPEQIFDVLDPRVGSVGSRHRTLIDSSPAHLRPAVHRAYLRHNAELLKFAAGLPLYLSESLGGVGLRVIYDPSSLGGDVDDVRVLYGPTPWQVKAADWLEWNPSRDVRQLPADAPIVVRSVWTKLLPYRSNDTVSYDMSEEDIGLLDVSSYYLVPSLVAQTVSKPGLPVLRANQRAWRRLRARFDRPPVVDRAQVSLSPNSKLVLD